jgi:hypothetical protein
MFQNQSGFKKIRDSFGNKMKLKSTFTQHFYKYQNHNLLNYKFMQIVNKNCE